MWKKINRNKLNVIEKVVARKGPYIESGFLVIRNGILVLEQSNGAILLENPEAYIKVSDLMELPFELSAKDLLIKEIDNSASGVAGIIIHPKLADRLLEEGAIHPNTLKSGYYFAKKLGMSGATYHKIYVSSDNMEPGQVIVF